MYYKGANMLHTIRQIVNNDENGAALLGINKAFYHQTVHTKQIEDYLSNHIGLDLTAFFNQYLRSTKIPIFGVQSGSEAAHLPMVKCCRSIFNSCKNLYQW